MKNAWFAFALCIALLWGGGEAYAANEKAIGSVVEILGDATAYGKSGIPRQLTVGNMVYAEERITTADKSRVQLKFLDDSIFTLGRNGEIILNKYVYDPATGRGEVDVKGNHGTFRFRTGKIAKSSPDGFKVTTPFAVIGVRGSGGVVMVERSGRSFVGLTSCCLLIRSKNMPPDAKPLLLSTVKTYTRIESPSQPPLPPKAMPLKLLEELDKELGKERHEEDENGESKKAAEGEISEIVSEFNQKMKARHKKYISRHGQASSGSNVGAADVLLYIPYNYELENHRYLSSMCVRDYGEYVLFIECLGLEDLDPTISTDDAWYDSIVKKREKGGEPKAVHRSRDDDHDDDDDEVEDDKEKKPNVRLRNRLRNRRDIR